MNEAIFKANKRTCSPPIKVYFISATRTRSLWICILIHKIQKEKMYDTHRSGDICTHCSVAVNPLTPTVAIWVQLYSNSVKHPVPDRVKSSFVIFDIRAL